MTPKEKADSLINKLYPHVKLWDSHNDVLLKDNHLVDSAIICVDEILNFDIRAKCESQFIIAERIESYWQQVKEELIKMKQG